jgi:hypothetical protein
MVTGYVYIDITIFDVFIQVMLVGILIQLFLLGCPSSSGPSPQCPHPPLCFSGVPSGSSAFTLTCGGRGGPLYHVLYNYALFCRKMRLSYGSFGSDCAL